MLSDLGSCYYYHTFPRLCGNNRGGCVRAAHFSLLISHLQIILVIRHNADRLKQHPRAPAIHSKKSPYRNTRLNEMNKKCISCIDCSRLVYLFKTKSEEEVGLEVDYELRRRYSHQCVVNTRGGSINA